MEIDGREIAKQILDKLRKKVKKLKKKGVVSSLHIITLTTDEASRAYVGQKKLRGEEIGVRISVENLNPETKTNELLKKIKRLNNDKNIHGIIIQRPLPKHIDETLIASSINSKKDVDGFHPQSKFSPPIALAVLKILKEVYASTPGVEAGFSNWLKSKKIAVIGRGVTAGNPIIKTFEKLGIKPLIITSSAKNREKILKNSDIIITAVGKPDVIKRSDIKKEVILIGVGMHRGKDGKFHGDYEEKDIKDKASRYTPTPGGIGPVNVAMFLSNLITAAEKIA